MNLIKLILLPILIFQGNCTDYVNNHNTWDNLNSNYAKEDNKMNLRRSQNKSEKIEIAKKTLKRNSKSFALKNLRDKTIAPSNMEIRIWSDQETLLHCLIISKNGNVWKASFLSGEFIEDKLTLLKKRSQDNLSPKSGWNNISMLIDKNIGFPFPYEIDDSDAVLEPDEGTIVLEVKKGENYGLVFYRKFSESVDGKTIIELCKLLQDEFNLDLGCR